MFELNHILHQDYQLSLNYTTTHDNIVQVPFQNSEAKTTTFRLVNLDRSHSLSMRALLPLKPKKWWTIDNTLTLNYNSYQASLEGFGVDNKGFNGYLQTQHKFSLPAGFKVEVTGAYVSPERWGVLQLQGFGWVEAGVKKSLFADKLEVALQANDIFRTDMTRFTVAFQNQNTYMRQYANLQSLRLSLRYKFKSGEKFDAPKSKGSNSEELNRTGGA